ncbi:MAG: D-alanine--D-alanine ligase [Bacteroidales bacterium]
MKTIAVVYGGYSSEFEVSKMSGRYVADSIDKNLYKVYEVLLTKESWTVLNYDAPINRDDFSFTLEGQKIKFDKIYIMIHGDPGENGLLQAYFEMLEIPYVGCSSLSSSLIFDKYASKSYLRETIIKLPRDYFIRKDAGYEVQGIVKKLGLPIFVKPNDGGSSFGITKVHKIEELEPAIEKAFAEGKTVLCEEAIAGRELTCAVYKDNEGIHSLPIIEIVTENEYFDYEAKYLGKSQEICPAPITDAQREKIQYLSKVIYRHFGCGGCIRVDYILSGESAYFLEVNPIPGMTEESLVPKMIKAAGMTTTEFLTKMIEAD